MTFEVDVALLYNPTYFTIEDSRKLFVRLPERAKENIFTRDVLWVKGKLDGETVHVFVKPLAAVWVVKSAVRPAFSPQRRLTEILSTVFKRPNLVQKFIVTGDLNDDPVVNKKYYQSARRQRQYSQ